MMIFQGGKTVYLFEIISIIVTPLTLLYIFIFLFSFGKKYLRIYNRNKILMFTHEQVKEKQKEISKIYSEMEDQYHCDDNITREESIIIFSDKIEKLFTLYNEIAIGINVGLYDELYVQMVLGNEMFDFYKRFYRDFIDLSERKNDLDQFMPLEYLLKKWDSDKSIY